MGDMIVIVKEELCEWVFFHMIVIVKEELCEWVTMTSHSERRTM